MSTAEDPKPELVVVPDESGTNAAPSGGAVEAAEHRNRVEEPAKVMRIGTMIKLLLEEVRQAPLDEKSRARLREIFETSVRELGDGLSTDLREELDRLASPFDTDSVPSESELRIAQAQLVGWLEGLFHGIQAAVFAQQASAQSQMQRVRQGGLPPATNPAKTEGDDEASSRPGNYL